MAFVNVQTLSVPADPKAAQAKGRRNIFWAEIGAQVFAKKANPTTTTSHRFWVNSWGSRSSVSFMALTSPLSWRIKPYLVGEAISNRLCSLCFKPHLWPLSMTCPALSAQSASVALLGLKTSWSIIYIITPTWPKWLNDGHIVGKWNRNNSLAVQISALCSDSLGLRWSSTCWGPVFLQSDIFCSGLASLHIRDDPVSHSRPNWPQ